MTSLSTIHGERPDPIRFEDFCFWCNRRVTWTNGKCAAGHPQPGAIKNGKKKVTK